MRVWQNNPSPAPIGAQDGTSWATAFVELRDATATGLSQSMPVEYWVADGTYRPTATSTDRDATFAIRAGDGLFGGFSGTESFRSERDAGAGTSILSGDITPGGPLASRSKHVVRVVLSGASSAPTFVDGLRIEKGFADDLGAFEGGGGILVYGVGVFDHVVLANLTITDCHASQNGGGAAVYLAKRVQIRHCSFVSNTCYRRTPNPEGTFDLEGSGAGLYLAYFSAGIPPIDSLDTAIANCDFSFNLAAYGGALCAEMQDEGQLSMLNCLAHDNHALVSCGGFRFVDPAFTPKAARLDLSHLTVLTARTNGTFPDI